MNKKAKIAAISALVLVFVVSVAIVFAAPKGPKECNDGIDNDGDRKIDYPADAGCSSRNDNDETNCGDGVCEGGETQQNCPADCGQPNSCSDTDGGIVLIVAGTVSGYSGGGSYNYSDYCVGGNSTNIMEYYCSGSQWNNGNYNCLGNTTTACSNGACV